MKRTNSTNDTDSGTSKPSNKVQRLSDSSSLKHATSDISICSICQEIISNPKLLPCFHTFCFGCLEKLDLKPKDEVPCPFCKAVFKVPTGGLLDLPKDIFLEKLLEARRISNEKQNGEAVACDICMSISIENGLAEAPAAEKYCVECQENMCGQCSLIHSKMKMSKSHQMLLMETKPDQEQLLESFRNPCDLHPKKEIDIFCMECKVAVCSTCFISKHNKHGCSDILQVVEGLKKQLKENIGYVEILITSGYEKSENLQKQMEDLVESGDKTDEIIVNRGEEIKSLVDKHVENLREELKLVKSKNIAEIEDNKLLVELQQVVLESFRSYSQEVVEKAVPIDVVRIAYDLNLRANQLKNQPSIGFGKQVSFAPTDLKNFDGKLNHSIIGKIFLSKTTTSTASIPTVVGGEKGSMMITSIPFVNSVNGVTISGKEIFAVLRGSNEILVYSSETFKRLRSIQVTGLNNPWDIAAGDGVVYVAERNNKFIYKVQLPGGKIMKWMSDSHMLGLSVMGNGNVLVTSFDKNKLIEYSPFGIVVKEITLSSDIGSPRHAIQLDDDHYLVCHVGAVHRVCLVDKSGSLLKSYGGIIGSQLGHLNMPCHLAVFDDKSLLVADPFNNRVLLLNPALELVREYIPAALSLSKPCRMCLDEPNKKLYVAIDNDKTIAVFGIP